MKTSTIVALGIALTSSAGLSLWRSRTQAAVGSPGEMSGLPTACAAVGFSLAMSGGVDAVAMPLCHLEIVEVNVSELNPPDLGPGFWVEDYVPPQAPDGLVKVGSCVGSCALPDRSCIPTAHMPVRIEHHGPSGVTPLRVWVPSACGCGTGLAVDYFYLDFEELHDLIAGILGEQGFPGSALGAALQFVPELDSDSSAALGRRIVERCTQVFALRQAPPRLRDANRGIISLTPALKAEIEQWIWTNTSGAILASLNELALSAASRAAVIDSLRQDFPNLFAP